MPPTDSVKCAGETARPLGSFERYLTVWVILCIAAGILLGKLAPSIATTLDDDWLILELADRVEQRVDGYASRVIRDVEPVVLEIHLREPCALSTEPM